MRNYVVVFVLCAVFGLGIAGQSVAKEYKELYGKWYVADWVSHTETLDGEKVMYGLRITDGTEVNGCIIYPDDATKNRKFFGQLFNTKFDEVKIRLSNGRRFEFEEKGKAPDNTLVLKMVQDRHRVEYEFEREFLPQNCI